VPTWDDTYPQLFAGVRVIQQARTAAQIGRLVGQNLPLSVVDQRLKSVQRLWVAETTAAWLNPPFPLRGFRLALAWQRNQMWLRLYVRVSHQPPSPSLDTVMPPHPGWADSPGLRVGTCHIPRD
jgi:hypothetical protein